ncbi:DEAD/DEAH box helicase [Siphonobacter aquaeclarae]|uniref:Superfamily II DNA and RNA helicase n=1 Tax=Siphonobacter aquaeclarae TaxID=563176 RepID=A0A1G9R333_9BACT|nr:DEAD/DEAH box helicase [Siphonobacter aquaeclarae]SDM17712.1 Superfamily II DNA and RNA helicase [Siphonobacter aquaeclarae]
MFFHEFALHDDTLDAIESMNFHEATPVQQMAIPKILSGTDLLACAQTGTGKTGAYLIPILDRIPEFPKGQTSTLILVPTRELAQQIDEQVQGLGYYLDATSIAIYGGNKGPEWEQQRKALTQGADIIIATPGRLIAHLQLGYVRFEQIRFVVLDEADRMLDMGFIGDIMNILHHVPDKRQTLLFSATMPPKIRELAKKILHHPEEINLAVSKPAEGIDQQFYLSRDDQKIPLLIHLMKDLEKPSMVLFTSRKSEVNPIVRALRKMHWQARGISSDSEQTERENILRDFKNHQFPILVATDVLSRGIDIDSLSHVVNFDVPRDPEDYVHRIGRTARAANKGTAITFINEQDQPRVMRIERLLERDLPKQSITEEIGLGPAPAWAPPSGKSRHNQRPKGQGAPHKPGPNNEKKPKWHGKKKRSGPPKNSPTK